MVAKLRSWLKPPVFETDEEKTRIAGLLNVILLAYIAALIVPLVVTFFVSSNWQYIFLFLGTVILLNLGTLFLMRRGQVQLASILFSIMLWIAFAGMSVFVGGVSGPAFNMLIVVIFIAGVLLGWRVGAVFAGVSILAGIGLFFAENNGLLPPSLVESVSVIDLVNRTVIFLMIVALAYVTSRSINQALDRAHRHERELEERNQELQASQQTLLAQAHGLEIVGDLSERLTSILDVDQLLGELVNQVKARFGYYHVHIYVLDDQREQLVVAEGTGDAGAVMKTQRHAIALNAPTSLVARAARFGQVVRVDDVRQSPDWLPNELLPDTRSEMAVPIVVDEQVVGVLDVQADEIAGLDENDAGLLRSLANQVAIAMRNARLFAQTEAALAEARSVQQQYVEHAWEQAAARETVGTYVYNRQDMFAISEATFDEAENQALKHDRPAIVSLDENEASPKALVAPIRVQDVTIGTFQIHKLDTEKSQPWADEDVALIEAVLDQVAQSAENLRLFEETRQRAGHEATIRDITDKLRAASNLNQLLAIASEELGQRMTATHVKLELGARSVPSPAGNGNSTTADG